METAADFLRKLDIVKPELELFLNTRNEPALLNRVKKFFRRPFRVLRVVLQKTGIFGSSDLSAQMFWGARLRLPAWDEDAILAYYTGSLGRSETLLVEYLTREIKPGSVFFDIGASLGLYTALGEALGAEVHSFEPNPETAQYIAKNAGQKTHVHAVALAEKRGEAILYDVSAGHKSGMSSFFPDITQGKEGSAKGTKVTTVTLDEYCTRRKVIPNIIKMDVMNADILVLQGAKDLFTKHAPVLALRLYNAPSAIERTHASLALLKEYGYASFKLQEDGALVPADIRVETLKFASTFIFKKV